jgi:hypothetical protein
MTATLTIVAATDSLIINLEKDFWLPGPRELLKAILFAIKPATFKVFYLSFKNNMVKRFIRFFPVISQYCCTIIVLLLISS